MLACLSVAAAYTPPLSAVTTSRRAVAPSMQATKKLWSFEGFDESTLFEAREVAYERPPVKILSRLNELKVSTAIADLVRYCKPNLHTLGWDGPGMDGHATSPSACRCVVPKGRSLAAELAAPDRGRASSRRLRTPACSRP